jgi:HAD superfamily hydrolase (TIGR01490 family)
MLLIYNHLTMRAAFFDIDGTLTSEHAWKGMMYYFQQRRMRRGTQLAYLLVHYPLYYLRRWNMISEVTFRAPWAANLAWYLRGFTLQQANELWDWTVEVFLQQYWRIDTRALLDAHRNSGDLVVLVSSGPQPMVERVARELGAQYGIGTRFEIRDGFYTGRSLKPVCIDEHKAYRSKELIESLGLDVDLSDSFAYADSVADLSLLKLVGHPVAVYPEPELQAIAENLGWRIYPDTIRS